MVNVQSDSITILFIVNIVKNHTMRNRMYCIIVVYLTADRLSIA
jgi:hypothetical protein